MDIDNSDGFGEAKARSIIEYYKREIADIKGMTRGLSSTDKVNYKIDGRISILEGLIHEIENMLLEENRGRRGMYNGFKNGLKISTESLKADVAAAAAGGAGAAMAPSGRDPQSLKAELEEIDGEVAGYWGEERQPPAALVRRAEELREEYKRASPAHAAVEADRIAAAGAGAGAGAGGAAMAPPRPHTDGSVELTELRKKIKRVARSIASEKATIAMLQEEGSNYRDLEASVEKLDQELKDLKRRERQISATEGPPDLTKQLEDLQATYDSLIREGIPEWELGDLKTQIDGTMAALDETAPPVRMAPPVLMASPVRMAPPVDEKVRQIRTVLPTLSTEAAVALLKTYDGNVELALQRWYEGGGKKKKRRTKRRTQKVNRGRAINPRLSRNRKYTMKHYKRHQSFKKKKGYSLKMTKKAGHRKNSKARRPSASYYYNILRKPIGTKVNYGTGIGKNSDYVLRLRKNGTPFWKKLR